MDAIKNRAICIATKGAIKDWRVAFKMNRVSFELWRDGVKVFVTARATLDYASWARVDFLLTHTSIESARLRCQLESGAWFVLIGHYQLSVDPASVQWD